MAFTWKAYGVVVVVVVVVVDTTGHGEPPFFGLGLSQDLVLNVLPVA